jgi:hypothetical protein
MQPTVPNEREFGDDLRNRYWLRWRMALLIAMTMLTGLGASKIMLEAGVTNVLYRYPISAIIAYGFFFLFTKSWIDHIKTNLDGRVRQECVPDLDVPEIPDLDWSWLDLFDEFGILLLAALIIGMSAYLIVAAPTILPDVAFQAIVVGIGGSGRRWIARLYRHTSGPFLVALTMSMAMGAAVHHQCPNAIKLADAFGKRHECVTELGREK